MGRAVKTRRRPRHGRRTIVVLVVLALAVTVGAWALFAKGWTPPATAEAPRFALASSTGRTIALADFLGKQEVVLIFYMGAG